MIPLAQDILAALEGADRAFAEWLDVQAREGRTVSCRRGCSACCELLTLITWPEGLLIAETLRKRGEVARYLPALHKAADAACFTGIDPGSYWQKRIPCPFLTPEKDCAIYERRPLPCRVHVVFSPPELCVLRPKNPTEPAPPIVGPDEGQIQAQVMGPGLAELAQKGFPDALICAPLAVMVLGSLYLLGENLGRKTVHPAKWFRRYYRRLSVEYHRTRANARIAR